MQQQMTSLMEQDERNGNSGHDGAFVLHGTPQGHIARQIANQGVASGGTIVSQLYCIGAHDYRAGVRRDEYDLQCLSGEEGAWVEWVELS
jgi:hypothetical protein